MVDTPAAVLCSWMRSSAIPPLPTSTTVAVTGDPEIALIAAATLAALLFVGLIVKLAPSTASV